ncbi:MAG TPA: hypothetical protein VLJ37_08515 [bacterium]|nr:hypothetical protein [bacterium]
MGQIAKHVWVKAENKPGTLAKVTAPLKEAGVSITACCAWGEGNQANVTLLTENNAKAIEALKKSGFSPTEQEVVTTVLPHRVGSLAEAAQKLGQANIDIQFCYGTTSGGNALAVFVTNDNKKAAGLI